MFHTAIIVKTFYSKYSINHFKLCHDIFRLDTEELSKIENRLGKNKETGKLSWTWRFVVSRNFTFYEQFKWQ